MIETMPLIAEAEAAVRAAMTTGLEVTVGFVVGDDGRLLSGEPLDLAVRTLSRYPVVALFVNCSPPAVVERAIGQMFHETDRAIGGYANLGSVEGTVGWSSDNSVSGERYAGHALRWLAAGAKIVGGCCGTRPEHIAAIRSALSE
jgi:S-methylmethionine-dependent homocysteine/selenocysteine methylase